MDASLIVADANKQRSIPGSEWSKELDAQEVKLAAYREALKEWTRERVPLNWAMTQSNVGVAFLKLREVEDGTARFEE